MTIPFGLTPHLFTIRYRRQLEKCSFAFIAELRPLFEVPRENGILVAVVEIFLDEMGERNPNLWLRFEGKNQRISRSDPSIFPGRTIKLCAVLDGIEPIDQRYFLPDGFETLNLQADLLKTWVSECWWKAGGWGYPIQTTVTVHDEYGNGENILLAPGQPEKNEEKSKNS